MKVSEFIKYLKRNGCVIKRNGSRHDIWYCERTGKEAAVPRHSSKELPNGTLNEILKNIGLR